MGISDFKYDPEVYNSLSAERVVPILMEKFHPRSVLDIGCGNGSWLRIFEVLGVEDVLGIDGEWVLNNTLLISPNQFLAHNIEIPLTLNRQYDLALCLETAEHLAESFAPQLVKNLTRHSDTIVFSAAIPGQTGDGHINLKEPDYWGELFRLEGYNTYDLLRPVIWDDENIHWWYKQNIFVASKSPIQGADAGKIPLRLHPEYISFMDEMKKPSSETGGKTSFFKRVFDRLLKKQSHG